MSDMEEVLRKVKIYPLPPDLCEQVAASVKRRLLTGYCWWAGHDVQRGDVISGGWQMYQLTPDYCERCLYSAEERDLEEDDFWHAAHRVYVWGCDHGGERWERVDLWLQARLRLPSWWEY